MKDDKVFPTVKPDTDNIAKSILDSLNNIAYLDDKQVVKLEVEKYYSDVASVVVMIDEVENERE
jgi:Holliday junction resolvase RusA-like endonuclease